MKGDAIAVVEAAYSLEGDDDAWLRGVVAALTRSFDQGRGALGLFFDFSDLDSPILGTVHSPCVPAAEVRAVHENAPPNELARLRVSGAIASTFSETFGTEWIARTCGEQMESYGIKDCINITATDATRVGCAVGLNLPVARGLRRRERHCYEHVAAHLATGLRLRRSLDASNNKAAPLRSADAILSAGGDVLHLEPEAASSREALRRHARTVDRARAALRRSDADGALDTWTAMVEGRWTLIDHFESDGRRLVIARRNDSKVAAPHALSPMERSVASLAALGHPNKIIAYELGLPTSTVSTHLADAIAKLGLSSRGELAAAFGALVRLVEDHDAR